MFDLKDKSVFVAGHRGMLGSALVRRLEGSAAAVLTRNREVLDLRRQEDVEAFIAAERPDAIIVAAAKAGGIGAHSADPVAFMADNLEIDLNILNAAHRFDVERVVMIGSSAAYPVNASQPIPEDALLTGPLDPNHQGYAIAKIAAARLSALISRAGERAYFSTMLCNLYGPGDKYDLQTSHVVPALMRKAHEARRNGDRELIVWGSGTPRREFLHVDDCADAIVFLLENYEGGSPVNVGAGTDVSIAELVRTICSVVGCEADLAFDRSKPDGVMRKLLDCSRLNAMGWNSVRNLHEGISQTYEFFKEVTI